MPFLLFAIVFVLLLDVLAFIEAHRRMRVRWYHYLPYVGGLILLYQFHRFKRKHQRYP